MNETTLKEILEEICEEEVNEYEKIKPPYHFFSIRHRKAMKEILYPHRQSQPVEISSKHRYIPVRKRLLIMTMVVVMAVMCITAGGAMIRGFNRKVYPDYTMLLAANAENCPKTIENVYYLPEIPEGYELYEENYNIYRVTKFYENIITKREMTFAQDVKEGYTHKFDNERNTFEEVDINGKYGLYLKPNNENKISGTIVWDNEDYILQISGDFTKNELIELAKSAKY